MTNLEKAEKPNRWFLVCEDGNEYLERFERFLGDDFNFLQARDFETSMRLLKRDQTVVAILMDLDFRRVPPEQLVDAEGRGIAKRTRAEVAEISANQGIYVLSSLRKNGIDIPVLLFADIDGVDQRKYLQTQFSPVEVVGSHVGLSELKQRLLAFLTG
jgi:hypothetical protein